MGFSDGDFEKLKYYSKIEAQEILEKHPNHFNKKQERQFTEEERVERMSNTQLYKMAGNSIVVVELGFLFCQIFDDENEIWV
jgi:hypothetical protein